LFAQEDGKFKELNRTSRLLPTTTDIDFNTAVLDAKAGTFVTQELQILH
jgi:hypothetical protein